MIALPAARGDENVAKDLQLGLGPFATSVARLVRAEGHLNDLGCWSPSPARPATE